MLGSASFHRVRKSRYAARVFALLGKTTLQIFDKRQRSQTITGHGQRHGGAIFHVAAPGKLERRCCCSPGFAGISEKGFANSDARHIRCCSFALAHLFRRMRRMPGHRSRVFQASRVGQHASFPCSQPMFRSRSFRVDEIRQNHRVALREKLRDGERSELRPTPAI